LYDQGEGGSHRLGKLLVWVVLVYESGEIGDDLAECPWCFEAMRGALLPGLLLALINAVIIRLTAHLEVSMLLCLLQSQSKHLCIKLLEKYARSLTALMIFRESFEAQALELVIVLGQHREAE